jgi:hypothetical protein
MDWRADAAGREGTARALRGSNARPLPPRAARPGVWGEEAARPSTLTFRSLSA